jgi:hypothetical protein
VHIGIRVKYLPVFSGSNKTEFSLQVLEKRSKTNIMKILPAGAKVFHAEGRTDRET